MAQLDACLTGDQEVVTSIVKIDHEIFSTVILPLLLIQDGRLSVLGEIMFTSTG